jgi:hypothetical protein
VVMGMVERGGKIIAGPVPDQTTYTLEGIINENVVEGSIVNTDDLASYNDLGRVLIKRAAVAECPFRWQTGKNLLTLGGRS